MNAQFDSAIDNGLAAFGNAIYNTPDSPTMTNSQRGADLLNNFYDTSLGNYVQTVNAVNNGLAAGNAVRADNAVVNASRDRRFAIGNAQAAADFNAVGVSGFNVDLNDDATRYAVALGIAQQDKQQLTNIALGIALAPTLFLGGGTLAAGGSLLRAGANYLGRQGIAGGIAGATVNTFSTSFKATADAGDYLQSAFTGFIGGAVAGRLSTRTNPYLAAAIGAGAGEATNQFIDGEINPGQFGLSVLTGVVGQKAADFLPVTPIVQQFDDAIGFGIGRGLDAGARQYIGNTLDGLSNGLKLGLEGLRNVTIGVSGDAVKQGANGLLPTTSSATTIPAESNAELLYRMQVGYRGALLPGQR